MFVIRFREFFLLRRFNRGKATELKATDFKLSLNLRVTNGSFLENWQVMSITSLSVLCKRESSHTTARPYQKIGRFCKVHYWAERTSSKPVRNHGKVPTENCRCYEPPF